MPDDDAAWLRWHLDARNTPDAGQPSTGSAVALWHTLSSVPSGSGQDGPRVPGFKSTTPIDDHVAAMLDRRTRPEKPGDVMSLWHVLDEAAQGLSAPGKPRDMAGLPTWLHPRAEAVLATTPGLVHDVQVCHRQMCAALGEPAPAIVGHCPHCGTALRYGGTAEVRCTGCDFSWNALVLLEIA